MAKRLLAVVAGGVVCGLAVDAAWGPGVGLAVAVYVVVMGLVVIVLERSRRDSGELEDELHIRRNRSAPESRRGGTRRDG
ncbi:MAG: hypothetical protein KY464_06055 [Gemmatimonadetes bacterium]|nr:hypothetical protein [Gemmatimonadota bacterium]